MAQAAELLPGTLDLLILKSVSLGKLHGYGVLLRIEQISGGALQIQQGALYPALYRLEQQGLIESEWGVSDNNRRAKYLQADHARPPAAARRIGKLEPRGRRDGRGAARDLAGNLTCARLLAYLRSFWRGLRRAGAARRRHARRDALPHRDGSAAAACSSGLDADEARRQAAIAFGGVEKYRGAGRDALGFTWAARPVHRFQARHAHAREVSGPDRRSRVFALSLAIGAGAAYLEFINDLMHGKLPFAEADRIVGIQNWDQADRRARAPRDGGFRGVARLAAFVRGSRGVSHARSQPDHRGWPRRSRCAASRSAPSAFRIARVPPLLGRPLVAGDERGWRAAGRGHRLRRVDGALRVATAGVIGRTVRLGNDDLHHRRRDAGRASACRSATACGCRCS